MEQFLELTPSLRFKGEHLECGPHVYGDRTPADWAPYFWGSVVGEAYTCLTRRSDNFLVMSNTVREVKSNQQVVEQAFGRVLMLGLGINLVCDAVLDSPRTTEVVVVERDLDVLLNVATRCQTHQADAYEDDLSELGTFDYIWADTTDTHQQDKMRSLLRAGGITQCWNLAYEP